MELITFAKQDGVARPGIRLGMERAIDINLAMRAMMPSATADMLSLTDVIAREVSEPGFLENLRGAAAEPKLASVILPSSEFAIRAPFGTTGKNIFCVGRNYVDHVAEGDKARGVQLALPAFPQFFTKPRTAIVGPNEDVRIDAGVSQRLDYEVELAIVIGRAGKDIEESNALDHVFGYTIVNDVSARDLQQRHVQWFKGKGLDGSCPIGPWIVTSDEIDDPQELDISLSINGEPRQHANTAQMIFDIRRIISVLSQGMTLEPGDVIATGTPSGVGFAMEPPIYLKDGDVMECRIDRIGTLSNIVRIP